MDNCFTSRRDRSRQTSEKNVLYILPAGPVTECAFAGDASCFLSRHRDIIASFSFGVWSVQMCFLQRNVFMSADLTCQSADIMLSLCGVGVRVNNFFSKTTRPRDMLFSKIITQLSGDLKLLNIIEVLVSIKS